MPSSRSTVPQAALLSRLPRVSRSAHARAAASDPRGTPPPSSPPLHFLWFLQPICYWQRARSSTKPSEYVWNIEYTDAPRVRMIPRVSSVDALKEACFLVRGLRCTLMTGASTFFRKSPFRRPGRCKHFELKFFRSIWTEANWSLTKKDREHTEWTPFNSVPMAAASIVRRHAPHGKE
jgi:hypothetical protein